MISRWIKNNSLRQKIKKRGLIFGVNTNIISTQLIEIFCIAGFDFIIFDIEHSALTIDKLENLITIAKMRKITPLVRIPEINASLISRILDIGCMGIMAPRVEQQRERNELNKVF